MFLREVDTPMPTMIFRCRHQVVGFPEQFQPSELSTQDSIEVIQTFIFLSQIETLIGKQPPEALCEKRCS